MGCCIWFCGFGFSGFGLIFGFEFWVLGFVICARCLFMFGDCRFYAFVGLM